ncbi:hypothetical protein ACTL7R_01925 [Priestia aryabhattai]|uniref:hypothetical protein n=1 Tax=Priestia TaxID=2800373 RepID=UPI003F89AB38
MKVIMIHPYIEQTHYAASSLIALIRKEEMELQNLKALHDKKAKYHRNLYDDFRRKEFDPEDHFNEYQMMHSFVKQATFFQEEIEPVQKQIRDLEISMHTRKESIRTLSGALLQLAKQGISISYGNIKDCPEGRLIYNEALKNIIWQGRNQSMHYEEGNFKAPLVRCFNNIGIELKAENSAKEVIDLLGWIDYQSYKSDMCLLLPK